MKRLTYILFALLAISCGGNSVNKASQNSISDQELLETVSRVMSDSTATPKDVTDAVLPLAERLLEMAKGTEKSKRVAAQGLSQELLMDIVFRFDNLTKEESEHLHECLNALGKVTDQWAAVKGADGMITLTKEIVYVSYQDSDESKEGIITIQVTPPVSSEQEPYVKMTFPSSAASSPALIFSRYISPESTEEDRDSWAPVEFEQWWEKDQLGDDIPMIASGKNNILEKMLGYDILYISFISEDLSEKCPGGYEAARMSLNSFKEEYVKHERDNYRYF